MNIETRYNIDDTCWTMINNTAQLVTIKEIGIKLETCRRPEITYAAGNLMHSRCQVYTSDCYPSKLALLESL